MAELDSHEICCVCLDNFLESPPLALECDHCLHGECLRELVRTQNNEHGVCPMCRGSTIPTALSHAALNPPPGFGPPTRDPFNSGTQYAPCRVRLARGQ